jgi:hypothetical protein
VCKVLASFAQVIVDRAKGDKLDADSDTIGEGRIAVEVGKKDSYVKGM